VRGVSQRCECAVCRSAVSVLCRVRDKGPEPDDSVIVPASKAEMRETAAISIAQRERDLIERLQRFSSVK